jgi:DNA ligase-1
MISPADIIALIASDNSKLHKEAVLYSEAAAGNRKLFDGLNLCYNPLITFGIKQVPEKESADGAGLDWEAFSLAVTGFVNRQITGNAARDMLERMMVSATQDQWNGWYRRILIKDMRAGFSESTINKAAKRANRPEYSIPLFECQLAHDGANHESKVTGRKLIEVKLDGVRVITVVYPDGRVDQFSRNGRELANFSHIREQMATLSQRLDEPFVFDGEVMSSSFQDLMRQVHRKTDVQSQDAVLYLFDWLSLAEFQAGRAETDQSTRSGSLRVAVGELDSVKVLGQELVDLDTEAGAARFREINADAIRNGYEGIMIKDPAAAYECKRSTAWLKQKPFIEVSLTVVDTEAGTGKNVGKLGALVCEGVDDGKAIRVNVGSGFSDVLRDDIWKSRAEVINSVVEVRADAVTQNQDGTYSLRFPRFKGFRGFTAGEKI